MAHTGVQASSFQVYRRLLPLYLSIVVGPLNTSGAFNLVPVFSEDFEVSLALAGLAITLYMVPFVASQVFSSAVAETMGATRALVLGFFVFSASCLAAAFAPTYEMFLAARMVQGLGGGLILPVGMAMAASQVPANRTGSAIGGLQAAFTLGVALGPGVAGVFAEELHWRGFYLFLALAGAVSGAVVAAAYSLRSSAGPKRGNPLRPLGQALTVRSIQVLSLTGLLLSFASVGVSIFIAVWLQRSGLLGPAGTGLLISVPGLVGVVASPVAGHLGDRWGVSRALLVGIGLTATGLAGLLLMRDALWAYPVLLVLTGMGSAATTTNLGAMALLRWPQLRQAVSGVFNGARFFGLALAPVVFTPVYQATSIRGVLAVSCVVLALSAGLVTVTRRSGSHDHDRGV